MISPVSNMAAPVRRLLTGVLSCVGSSSKAAWRAPNRGCRGLASGAGGAVVSPWRLHGAVCLKRPALVSQSKTPFQQEVEDLLQEIELEQSLYSDHELKLMEDAERLKRKQSDTYDSDDEPEDQDIVTAQDLEDTWEQRWRSFKFAPRVTEADKKNDCTSLNRQLENTLFLLVKEKIGNEDIWMFPQMEWQAGETMRQTAERVMSNLSGDHAEAHFLGNAPCGFYKYKFPKSLRSEHMVGAKVFFFKAFLKSQKLQTNKKSGDYVWVSKDEFKDYLKPAYLSEVDKFVIEIQ